MVLGSKAELKLETFVRTGNSTRMKRTKNETKLIKKKRKQWFSIPDFYWNKN